MVMRTPTPTLTIGEFGRRSGLSGKTLRLCDNFSDDAPFVHVAQPIEG